MFNSINSISNANTQLEKKKPKANDLESLNKKKPKFAQVDAFEKKKPKANENDLGLEKKKPKFGAGGGVKQLMHGFEPLHTPDATGWLGLIAKKLTSHAVVPAKKGMKVHIHEGEGIKSTVSVSKKGIIEHNRVNKNKGTSLHQKIQHTAGVDEQNAIMHVVSLVKNHFTH